MGCASIGGENGDSYWRLVNNSKTGQIFYNGDVLVGNTSSNSSANLQVNGFIKVGDSPMACNTNSEGAIRCNKTTHAIEYRGGATLAWTSAVPSSSWCGFSWKDNCGGKGWSPGSTNSDSVAKNVIKLCQGLDPLQGCPNGFTRTIVQDVQGTDRTNACYYTCISN